MPQPALLSRLPTLPPEILLQIFHYLYFEDRRLSIPRVCKSWASFANALYELWAVGCTHIDVDWCSSVEFYKVMRWLMKRGNVILRLVLKLRIGQAMLPDLWGTSAIAIPTLLPNLQVLVIEGHQGAIMAEHQLRYLQHLTCLTWLDISVFSSDSWELDSTEPLKHLKALQYFRLEVLEMDAQALLLSPALSCLTNLTELCLQVEAFQDRICKTDNIAAVVGHLTLLQELRLDGVLEDIPPCLGRLSLLSSLTMGLFTDEGPASAMPASCWTFQHLTFLSIAEPSAPTCRAWASMCRSLRGLSSLKRLHIVDTDLLLEVDDSAWAFPPQLTALNIESCPVEKVPTAVSTLKHLVWSHIEIEEYASDT